MASLNQRRELANKALEAQRLANLALARQRRDPVLWAESVWTIRGDTDQPYKTDDYPFIREIVKQQATRVTIMAAAGCSKTESFIPYALAKADWGGRLIYCFENDNKTGLIVQERVNPNFKSNRYLQSRNSGEVDNIHLKKIGSGFVYFLGLGTDSATRSYHGDEVLFDEYDAMDPLRLIDMEKRLASSTVPLVKEISNPSQPDYGIHRQYKLGDMRRWHVTCDACGDEQPLDYTTHVDVKKLILVCPSCKAPLQIRRQRWIPTNPKGTHPSYHIHRLMTKSLNIGKLVQDLTSEDWRTVSAATRMDLGLPYEDKDTGLTESDLRCSMGNDDWTKYAPGGFLVCDPGGLFDVQIWKAPVIGQPPTCCWIGTVRDWRELYQLVEESKVMGGAIDFGPENKAALEFCEHQRSAGKYFVRIAYTLSETPGGPDWAYDRNDPLLIQANRTASCDTMVMEVRQGKVRFPARLIRDQLGRWSQHMKSPKRVVEYDDRGKLKIRWHHEETRPDHQFHCTNYASIYRRAAVVKGGGKIEVVASGTY